jgi:hypothetical protein
MGFAADAMRKDLEDKDVGDAIKLLWRVLLIATEVPIVDRIFQLIEDRMRLPESRGKVFVGTLDASRAMRQLCEEADPPS